MPVLGVLGLTIVAIALIAIVATFIYGEKGQEGKGFYQEMNDAEAQGR